jgi:hypothetical protein
MNTSAVPRGTPVHCNGGEVPAPSHVYLVAIGPPALKAVLVILILPNPSSCLEGLPGLVDVFAGGVAGVVVVFVVVLVVDEPDDLDAGGLAAVEVVAGVVGVVDPVGPVGVLAVVVAEATLVDPPPDPSPHPAIATTAHRHATRHAADLKGDMTPPPD